MFNCVIYVLTCDMFAVKVNREEGFHIDLEDYLMGLLQLASELVGVFKLKPLMRQLQQKSSAFLVCFSHLLKCLRSLYGKQCGPRSDCSYRSSLFVNTVCFYT